MQQKKSTLHLVQDFLGHPGLLYHLQVQAVHSDQMDHLGQLVQDFQQDQDFQFDQLLPTYVTSIKLRQYCK